MFWQTVRRLRKGTQGLAQAVLSRGGELLTQTDDIVGWLKEHFEELLNPTSPSSEEETESEDSGEAPPISLAEVTEVVKKRRLCLNYWGITLLSLPWNVYRVVRLGMGVCPSSLHVLCGLEEGL